MTGTGIATATTGTESGTVIGIGTTTASGAIPGPMNQKIIATTVGAAAVLLMTGRGDGIHAVVVLVGMTPYLRNAPV